MKRAFTILFCLLFALTGVFSLYSAAPSNVRQQTHVPSDSTNRSTKILKYPIKKSIPDNSEEASKKFPVDLRNPKNIRTVIEYDTETGYYMIKTRMGDTEIGTPINLTADEFVRYQEEQSAADYWRNKNKIDYSKKKDDFSLTDMQFDLGAGNKIFGEGGIKLRTQGSIETKFSIKNNKVDNPSLSENAKDKTYFDYNQDIQMSVNGKVGDKINVNMNYDTKATFNYDTKAIKLRYDGKEDEIIKTLEGGNVSMATNSSLITGGTSLFGVKTELQFGKLNVAAVLSQQQAKTKSVSLNGGVQTSSFSIDADAYDECRHYFLSQYFRNNYDSWFSKTNSISSGINITKVEVWVTNKTGVLDNARNIIAFADLAEPSVINNNHWTPTGVLTPSNGSNSLYSEFTTQYATARTFSNANATMAPLSSNGIEVGEDYERLESARLLSSSEYTLNSTLGYISLKQALSSDEILAVSYEYSKNGQTYQVGEFSTDGIVSPQTLFVKLLKGTDYSPKSPVWNLMMKNIYSLGSYNLQSTGFSLKVTYKSDSVGTDMIYLTEGNTKNTPLLRVMGLDRLNSNKQSYPDGLFDYVEGYTVQSANGRIIFPVLEPFGSDLRKAIGNDAIADKYIFQELYDSTLTAAQQMTEKNKFKISGTYKASSGSTISLGATNVAQGSVKVTAGGQTLTENTDYTVDYTSGTVTILNESLLSSGTAINATCEDQSAYSMMRKTLVGSTFNYKLSDDFNLGGTLMHLSETPLTTKVDMGYESVNNTIWGLNSSFKTQSQFLTNLIDKLPFVTATKPSTLSVNGEFAQLIAGSSSTMKGLSYVDDFESAKKTINLKDPNQWFLSSTPYDPSGGLFPEAALSNDVRYGYNRALLSWYVIDGIFTENNSSQTPGYIKNDVDQLSDHYVRAVKEKELFPNISIAYNQTGLLSVMNLAYYPKVRGPYNYDYNGMNTDGTLSNPAERWGGIMRKIESGYTNFESNNVQYIEFWVMDPFVYDTLGVSSGGDLYFNLGEISEDVLKDGKRSFENGLPTSASDTSLISSTVWGKVSGKTSTAYAFDNTSGVRKLQDVGLDGLSDKEEATWPADASYVAGIRSKVDLETLNKMEKDPFSPLNDPSGDDYHYFRGSDYDKEKAGILERYKHYNGTEGNSQETGSTGESYSTASTTLPDVEDINLDYTLNETERYYQYKVSLRHQDMVVGKNFIEGKQTSTVTLKNGKSAQVSWYQFKIPVTDYEKKVGTISGFTSIRFMRMFLTGFQDSTILRFGTLNLVRGDWRKYTDNLYTTSTAPATDATVDLSTVSLDENSSRQPINYKMPPGVTQETDPSQPGAYLEDEQSLSMKIADLSPGDARAIYKNTTYDFRQYDRLQMFVHSEAIENDLNPPKDYEMTVFMRLGTDYQDNYYEYEIPMEISPFYVNTSTSIWPTNNFFDIPFDLLTTVKKDRNSSNTPINYTTEYSEYDPDHGQNKVKIKGNPSLSSVKTIMIGIRNKGTVTKSVEVWVDELRLSGFNDQGGWAALGSAVLSLSDLGTITASGKYETAGFGGLEQSVSERRLDNYSQYNVAFNFDLGKFLPSKAKISFPFYYSLSQQLSTPKYDPLNDDLLLSDVLKAAKTKAERDSILNYSETLNTYRSLNLSNVRLNIRSPVPLPLDPANFAFNYSSNVAYAHSATVDHEITGNYAGGVSYGYSSPLKAWQPFAKDKGMTSPWLKVLKDFDLSFLPSSLTLNSNLTRYYYELQSRDLTSTSSDEIFPLTVSKNFLWNTDLAINWNVTKNLKLNFSINNKAQIEETKYAPVNKELYKTEYENWKDTVTHSLLQFGTPLSYTQMANVTWQAPLSQIPALDFMTLNTQYNSQYNWTKSSTSGSDETDYGNQISNQRILSLSSSANLMTLYNKSDFLKNILKESKGNSSVVHPPERQANARTQNRTSNEVVKDSVVKDLKKYIRQMTLFEDSAMLIKHNLKNKRVYAVVVDSLGKNIPVKFKIKDENSLILYGTKKEKVRLTVFQKPPLDDEGWYKAAKILARTVTSVRNISVSYKQTDGMTIPGFQPESGLLRKTDYGTAPGWDFALGFQPDDYLEKAVDKGWLIVADSITSPAIITNVTDLRIKASLEPLPGLKIELDGVRSWSNNTQIEYMFDGMPQTKTGTFTMTTIALSSAFESVKSSNGYYSKHYQKFLDNRTLIATRLENKMSGKLYPNSGFLSGTTLEGTVYNPSNGSFGLNSADVLIPAFLSAYTGKSASSSSLDLFPALKAMLPNWSISYDGLSNLDFVKKYFKNVTLSHAYVCTYNVSSYSSYSTYVDAGDGLGFVRDVLTENPVPSSMYDVSSVTLTESFNPLIRIQGTLNNGWTLKTELRKSRTLDLSISGGQIVEADQNQYVVGTNYKISNFHPWGFLEASKVKNDLSLTGDFTYKTQYSLLRKIDENYTQASSGTKSLVMELLGDYAISKSLNFTIFYDLQATTPLVSSYPVTSSDFGFSLRFSLNR